MNKDISKPVLVTGANGYVASWIVKKLLEEGFTVHAAVRSPENENKVGHLSELAKSSPGKVIFFKADLLEKNSYAEAMKGCEVVFHTASPFSLDVDNPKKELIEPAVQGTANVLQSANKTDSVKRVVVTSSCAAMFTDAIDTQNTPKGHLTEDVWNTTASLDYQPYSLSKTLAEKKAWEIAEAQNQWELVTVNMSLVLGPPLNPKHTTSESMKILKQMGDGTMRFGAPNLGIGVVDVRDVADAHFRAAFHPNAQGRYITSAYNSNFLELAEALQPKYGEDYPIPNRAMPKWLLMIVGPLINKSLTRRYIKNNVNIDWKADNSKIKNDLNMEFRPLRETMEDSFQALIKNDVV